MTFAFEYDHNGLRTRKVMEASWYPETTNYFLHGKLLTHMTVEYTDFDEVAHQDKLHFFYDAQSRPAQVSFNGVLYTYVHNLQGDVVGILDSTGALVVEYKYDAWGKPISTTGNLADTLGKRNPFRYRGYVYDEETGLYYLRSRYYNPEIGRFVNADTVLGQVGAICSHNSFAYCVNNPIAAVDPDGQEAVLVVDTGKLFEVVIGIIIIALSKLFDLPITQSTPKTRSSSASTSEKSLANALTKAGTVDAKTLCNDIFDYSYYFAFVSTKNGSNVLNIVPYPLTADQAKMVLYSERIYSALLNTFGFNEKMYGIYTPTSLAAEKLANDVYGSYYKSPHNGFIPGDYYPHFHDALHEYHIWFGSPTISV